MLVFLVRLSVVELVKNLPTAYPLGNENLLDLCISIEKMPGALFMVRLMGSKGSCGSCICVSSNAY